MLGEERTEEAEESGEGRKQASGWYCTFPSDNDRAMAWLDKGPACFFHVSFRLSDRKFKRSLCTKNGGKRDAWQECSVIDLWT
jgi:hypothetical protein